eukprot:Skav208936  [mRNA]  locus=scaffold875:79663:81240:+ [translate_table: standard]
MSLDTFVVPSPVLGSWPVPAKAARATHGTNLATYGVATVAWCGAVVARGRKVKRRAGSFGPTPISEEQKEDIKSTQVGSRVSYVILRITNQDREHRFRYRIAGRSGEEKMERLIENQYEVAPTVINFTRSLMVSFAQPLGELTESGLSNTKGRGRVTHTSGKHGTNRTSQVDVDNDGGGGGCSGFQVSIHDLHSRNPSILRGERAFFQA